MKKITLLFLLFILCISMQSASAQKYNALLDSCYKYLSSGDLPNFEHQYTKLYDAYEFELDSVFVKIRQELLVMHDKDQGIRLLLIDAEQKGDKQKIVKIREIMKQVDKQNALRVMEIIDTNGWLSKDDIGDTANETLFLCIQHVDDKIIQDKYLPILKQAAEDGDAEGWHYAFLTDRIKLNSGKKQVFGTQTISEKGKFSFIVPLQEPEKVDIYRAELGLEPLNNYLDGKWNLEEYKKNEQEIERKYREWHKNRVALNKN